MALKPVGVFLDSNVILSGLLSDRGAPRVILDLISLSLPFLKDLTGNYNILEIERNLNKKLPACIPVFKKYLPKPNLEIIFLPTREEIKKYAGATAAKDTPVLVSALNGKADFLVTGDKKDFWPLKKNGSLSIKVVSPAEFLALIPKFIERS